MDFCRQFAFFENCPQIVHKLPPKSPVSVLVCNPMTEAAPVEFSLLHTSKLQ